MTGSTKTPPTKAPAKTTGSNKETPQNPPKKDAESAEQKESKEKLNKAITEADKGELLIQSS
jgi:hypothetical protein